MLTAIGGELAHADSQRAEHEVLVAQATMEEVRELKTELKEAEGSLAEQRALIGALAQGNAAPATSEEGEQAARRMRRQMPPPTASLRHVHRQHRSPSRPRATRSTRPRSSQRWDTDAAEVLHGAMQQCGARRAARGTTRHVAHGTRPTRHVAHGMRHAESPQMLTLVQQFLKVARNPARSSLASSYKCTRNSTKSSTEFLSQEFLRLNNVLNSKVQLEARYN